MWQDHEVLTVPPLETVLQRRPIHFGEDSRGDLYSAVGSDAKQMRVVSGVMQFAQGHAVVHRWHPKLVCIRDDVCSVEKFNVPQRTDGTTTTIRTEDMCPEYRLVQPSFRFCQYVPLHDYLEGRVGHLG